MRHIEPSSSCLAHARPYLYLTPLSSSGIVSGLPHPQCQVRPVGHRFFGALTALVRLQPITGREHRDGPLAHGGLPGQSTPLYRVVRHLFPSARACLFFFTDGRRSNFVSNFSEREKEGEVKRESEQDGNRRILPSILLSLRGCVIST